MGEQVNCCYLCGCEDVEMYEWKMGDISKPEGCEAYGIRREVNCSDCGNYEITSRAADFHPIELVRNDKQLLRTLRRAITVSTATGKCYCVKSFDIAPARERLVPKDE